MTQSPDVTPIGPSAARLTRAARAGGRDALLVVIVEVWGAGGDRADLEARLAGGIATVFERRSGSTTTRLKAALEAADDWLRRVAATAEGLPPPVDGDLAAGELGAGASVLVLAGEEAILAQVGPAVAYARPADAGTGAKPEPARYPTTSPWLRRGVATLSPQPFWTPLGMGRGPQASDPELDIHWAHWWMAPGSSALVTTTAAALALPRDVVGPLLATPPDRIAAALSGILPADLPAVHVAQHGASSPTAATQAPTAAVQASTPATQASTAAIQDPTTTTQDPTTGTAPQVVPAAAASVKEPTANRQATPVATRAGLPRVHVDLVPAWLALRETTRRAVVGGARLGARVLLALLPTRAGSGASGYQADWARFAAVVAILLPLALVSLALVMRARALTGDLAP